jgi:hypothetical protein
VRISACLVLGILLPSVISAQKTEPRFGTYAVKVWSGEAAALDLSSHKLARMYRTSLREQLPEEGVNFAGHCTVAVMGCGPSGVYYERVNNQLKQVHSVPCGFLSRIRSP